MRKLLAVAFVLIANLVQAQTVPGPRVSIAFDKPQSASCESTAMQDAWNFTYGTCYKPAAVVLGSPFITQVKVVFTGATTVTTFVPRSQVVVETTAARCSTGSVPCLRINDLPAPVGASQVTIRFVDGEAREGAASAAVPFSANPPLVPAVTGLRLPAVQ